MLRHDYIFKQFLNTHSVIDFKKQHCHLSLVFLHGFGIVRRLISPPQN